MSLQIRFCTIGKKHQKSYRLVVAEKRSKRNGQPLEVLGYYYPLRKKEKILINYDKVAVWQKKGAQVTPAVQKIITQVKS